MTSCIVPDDDNLPAGAASARTKVDDMIRAAHRLLVVFDDQDGIAHIPQIRQRIEQPPVVPGMKADRGLIQNIQNATEFGSDLGCKPYALPFAAGQGGSRPVERKISDSDIQQELHAVADFPQYLAGNFRILSESALFP